MTAAGVRRARHPCGTLIVVCTVLTATAPSSFGFQVAVPSSSRGSSSSSNGSSSSSRRDHSSSERRASRPRTLGQTHQAQQRVSAGIVLYEEGVRHLRRRESALLSQLEDSTDEGGQEQQQVFEVSAVYTFNLPRATHQRGGDGTEAVYWLCLTGSRSEVLPCRGPVTSILWCGRVVQLGAIVLDGGCATPFIMLIVGWVRRPLIRRYHIYSRYML